MWAGCTAAFVASARRHRGFDRARPGTRIGEKWLPCWPRDDLIQRAEAAAFTDDSKVVAVAEGGDRSSYWSFPGGRREPGESIEDTLRRELLEEACAHVKISELLFTPTTACSRSWRRKPLHIVS
jgi:8-oxo-dGTP pyrophosphatase MutT (NUDIX family)